MSKAIRSLIAANWKMNGGPDWADKPLRFDALYPLSERDHIDVLICPPALYINAMTDMARQTGVFLGAQNCHEKKSGAYTGSLSADMLVEAGADYVILGHSERRAAGDTNKSVKAKASAAGKADLIPIICVGETEDQREKGNALKVVKAQIKGSLPTLAKFVIAYEPVWAIGTGKVATLEDITEVHDAIRAQVGDKVQILYGGSVKPANAEGILALENVNGALIGGAGLEMDSLAEVARLAPSS